MGLLDMLFGWIRPRPRPPAPTPGPLPVDFEGAVISLINQRRAAPLNHAVLLTRAAAVQAADSREQGRLNHTGQDGSNVGDRMRRVGYNYATGGECLAYASNPADAVSQWLNSPEHKKIMLNPKHRDAGVAVVGNVVCLVVGSRQV